MKKGFTLIELMIVIAVIAILSGVILNVLNPAFFQGKARDARRKTDLTAIQSALELYFEDTGGYIAGNNLSGLVPDYATAVPTDPLTGAAYDYLGTPADYELDAVLERDLTGMANDGGNNPNLYEVGTKLTLL